MSAFSTREIKSLLAAKDFQCITISSGKSTMVTDSKHHSCLGRTSNMVVRGNIASSFLSFLSKRNA